MASDNEDDPDLESLRLAAIASLKAKPTGSTANSQDGDKDHTKSVDKDEEEVDSPEEEEEDLHALRLAALKSKREDGVPKEVKPTPAIFERQGNLISIQIVDPEEEKRKAEEERIAKAKALAAQNAEASKAVKPARFRHVESDSESEDDASEDDADNNASDSEESEDGKSMVSASSSSSSNSASSSSSSSKSSESSSSESDKESTSASASDSDSRRTVKKSHVRSDDKGKKKTKESGSEAADHRGRSESGRKEDKGKIESSAQTKKSVKDRLGVRVRDRQGGKSAIHRDKNDSHRNDRERRRDGERNGKGDGGKKGQFGGSRDTQRDGRRPNRRQESKVSTMQHSYVNDKDKRTERPRDEREEDERQEGRHKGDLRERLKREIRGIEARVFERQLRRREHSTSRQNTEPSPPLTNKPIRASGRDLDRRLNPAVSTRNRNNTHRHSTSPTREKRLDTLKTSDKNKENTQLIKKEEKTRKLSAEDSLSDIPLESDEENEQSDKEDVRFRKGRHDPPERIDGNTGESNAQSRLVMSLTLPTDSELKKADEEQQRDFKRRKRFDDDRGANKLDSFNRGRGRIDLRSANRRQRSFDDKAPNGRTTRPSEINRRVGKPRPSDFVSESESDAESNGAGIRSQVSGSGDARKDAEDVSRKRPREEEKNRESLEQDRNGKERKRARREKKSKKKVVKEKEVDSDDNENGEELVEKLSIRNRLGDRPIANLCSSIKSRLGPKISSPNVSEDDDTELPEALNCPRVRKVAVSFRNSDNSDDDLPEFVRGEVASEADEDFHPITKHDDLRHKMKRKLHRSDKNEGRGKGDRKKRDSSKRKIVQNKVWAEVLEERSSGEEREESRSRSRSHEDSRRSRREEKKRKLQEAKEREKKKSKDEEILEEKIKRMQEMNAAIMEKHKRIQKEKEMFDC